MRLWHIDLLSYLPDMQFKGQLRELVAIMRDWRDTGSTNHLLINYVMSYSTADLYEYFRSYEEEWNKRYSKPISTKYIQEFIEFCDFKIDRFRCYKKHHNNAYLRICMANLYEKYLGIGKSKLTDEEWYILRAGYEKITGKVYVI